MLNVNKFESKYKSFVNLTGKVSDLFESVRVEKHCNNEPNYWESELTLSLPTGFFNNKSYYVKPSGELTELLKTYNIYGDPVFKDVYISVDQFGNDNYMTLSIKYQQILGSYKLIKLTHSQFKDLLDLVGYDG